MHRRDLLKATAAAAAAPLWPTRLLAAGSAAPALQRVRPGGAQWPAAAEWQKLRAAVGGNLIEVRPLFAPCQADAKSAACQEVLQHIRNPFYIGDQPAGTQVSGWLDAWTPAASAYAVKARHAADVAAAVNFARTRNLRLVVKGGGHSYQGTSNAPDSLLIWTRAMNRVTLHDAFVPRGCEGRVKPQPAVSAGSGCMWIDLYNAVTTQAGRYVQGGGCTTVGVAGLIQSGGFGSFSKRFGTAASSLLEAEIVTADGAVRIVNACTDPDLFWAIKGGGGGSWGVITRLTLRTHDLPEYLGGADGEIRAVSPAAFRKVIARFVEFYATDLFNPYWGEQAAFTPDNVLKLSMSCQGMDSNSAMNTWRSFANWVKQSPQEFTVLSQIEAGAGSAQHYWDAVYRKQRGSKAMVGDARTGAPAAHAWWQGDQEQMGAFLHGYDSLWLPSSLLRPDQQPRLVDALLAASRYKTVGLHFNKGLAGAPTEAIAAARDTATNAAATEAFALAIIADGEMPAYPGFPRPAMDMAAAHKDARLIDLATAELRKVAPGAGSYVSESNYFNTRWQDAYWGANYPRLRSVKDKYDPGGLFFVHNGVGSEDWSKDGFVRVAPH